MIDMVERETPTPETWLLLGASTAGAWVASGFRPFTGPAAAAALGSAVVVFGRAARTRRRRRGWREFRIDVAGARGRRLSLGAVAWVVVIAALCGWELFQYASHPRSAHPTLSSIEGLLLATHWRRAGLYFLWLVAGWDLAGR